MTTRILKFTLHERGSRILEMPRGADLLHVGDQLGALQLWAQCEETEHVETRLFAVLYTGFDEVPENAEYLGTVISSGGNIVRHVYEILDDGD